MNTDAVMSTDEIVASFNLQSKVYDKKSHAWAEALRKLIHTRFIEAQRLQGSQMLSERFAITLL